MLALPGRLIYGSLIKRHSVGLRAEPPHLLLCRIPNFITHGREARMGARERRTCCKSPHVLMHQSGTGEQA